MKLTNLLPIIAFAAVALLAGNPPRITKKQKQIKSFTGHDIARYYMDLKGKDYE